jgi:hypothetical protein
MRARRPVLPASVSLPPASKLSASPESRLVQERTRPSGKDASPAVLRMWTEEQASSFSAATTPQGPGASKYVTADPKSGEGSVLKTLRWDASSDEFRLVKGNVSDARNMVPVLDGKRGHQLHIAHPFNCAPLHYEPNDVRAPFQGGCSSPSAPELPHLRRGCIFSVRIKSSATHPSV